MVLRRIEMTPKVVQLIMHVTDTGRKTFVLLHDIAISILFLLRVFHRLFKTQRQQFRAFLSMFQSLTRTYKMSTSLTSFTLDCQKNSFQK